VASRKYRKKVPAMMIAVIENRIYIAAARKVAMTTVRSRRYDIHECTYSFVASDFRSGGDTFLTQRGD
jgi:hypothetical protein